MRRRDTNAGRAWMGRLAVLGSLMAPAFGLASPAQAADSGDGLELQAVAVGGPQLLAPRGEVTALRWARQMEWTRMTLAEPTLPAFDLTDSRDPWSPLRAYDLRDPAWTATPRAASTVASAVASLATRGIPMLSERRDHITVRRHHLGCYFKARGGGLIWRVEF
ncbi:MAG: hypothetical protein AAGA54_36820 [Myxococcota bacterium]